MKVAEEWPTWPKGEQGNVLVDVLVDKPIDEVFLLLYGGLTDLKVRTNSALSHDDYVLSGWYPSEHAALAAPPAPSRPLDSTATIRAGMACKTSFTAPSMGSRYPTQELLRIAEAAPGQKFVVHLCVRTSAMYGDRFRPVIRTTLQAAGPTCTSWNVCATLVFVTKVNGLLKSMIERGAREGMNKSSRQLTEVMGSFATVRPADGGPAPAQPAAALEPAPAAEGAAPPEMPLAHLLGAPLLAALDPWAAFVHSLLASVPALQGVPQEAWLAVLAVGASMGALHVALAVVQFFANAARDPQDMLAWVARLVFKVVRVPNSLLEVVSTLALCMLVRALCNRLATALPAPPALPPLPASPLTAASGKTGLDEVHDSEGGAGVKYDGYAAAIASAAATVRGDENGLIGSTGALQQLNLRSEVALEQLRKGLVRVASPFSAQDDSGSASLSAAPLGDAQLRRQQSSRRRRERSKAQGEGEAAGEGDRGASVGAALSPGALSMTSSRSPSPRGRRLSRRPSPRGLRNDRAASGLQPLSTEGYTPPELPRSLRARAIVGEVFENERLQPFRGWGHSWPGHFLPTDRAQHWSTRDASTPDVLASECFEDVAPPLPLGWRWVEPCWHLDLSGVLSDSVDPEGWSYGLDFSWVSFPFEPGAGRKKIADFVRRRRWLRTRVPLEIEGSSEAELSPATSARLAGAGTVHVPSHVDTLAARAAMRAALQQELPMAGEAEAQPALQGGAAESAAAGASEEAGQAREHSAEGIHPHPHYPATARWVDVGDGTVGASSGGAVLHIGPLAAASLAGSSTAPTSPLRNAVAEFAPFAAQHDSHVEREQQGSLGRATTPRTGPRQDPGFSLSALKGLLDGSPPAPASAASPLAHSPPASPEAEAAFSDAAQDAPAGRKGTSSTPSSPPGASPPVAGVESGHFIASAPTSPQSVGGAGVAPTFGEADVDTAEEEDDPLRPLESGVHHML